MLAALKSHLWAYPALEMVHLSGIALLLGDLAPLAPLQAWKVDEIKPGTQVSVLGFTFAGGKGRRCCAPNTCLSMARRMA